MALKPKNPDWQIHSDLLSGWYAWNCRTRQRITLVVHGSFSKAVQEFERVTGHKWYGDQ